MSYSRPPLSHYDRETAFLTQILFYDQSFESRDVDERIARAHRERACVQKAAFTAAVFALLAFTASRAEFFQSEPKLRLWFLAVGGLASMICFLTFLGLFVIYCIRLNNLREECRSLIRRFFETRLLLREQAALTPAVAQTQPSSSGHTTTIQSLSSYARPATLNGDAQLT